jgi:hypothetical protein
MDKGKLFLSGIQSLMKRNDTAFVRETCSENSYIWYTYKGYEHSPLIKNNKTRGVGI